MNRPLLGRWLLAGLTAFAAGQVAAQTIPVQNGSFTEFSPCYSCWNGVQGATSEWGARRIAGSAALGPADPNNPPSWGPTMPGWGDGGLYAFNLTASLANNGWLDYNGDRNWLVGNITASPDGGKFVAMDKFFTSGIKQSIGGLTQGAAYAVSFYMAATSDGRYPPPIASGTLNWDVALGSNHQASMSLPVQVNTFSGWFRQTLYFVAGSTQETLAFAVTGTGNNGQPPYLLLDGISVSQVPEPSHALLLLGGVLALGALRLRNRNRA